jgi:prepilin-type processing-associated H-X9-DG protein
MDTNKANVFVLARSYHAGGVNLGFVDGSAKFVADAVDAVVFRATGTRNGNESGGTL